MGSLAGHTISLPGAVLRAKAIELIGDLLAAAVPAGLKIAYKPAPFTDFDHAWVHDDSANRTVFTMGAYSDV